MKCLIVGGEASISKDLKNVFTENSYKVLTASRDSPKANRNQIIFCMNSEGDLVLNHNVDLSHIDVVVFCIGKLIGKALEQYSNEEVDEAFNSNIVIVIKFLKKIIPLLNDDASVVFIGSIAASAGSFDEVYSSSKAALYGLTKSLSKKKNRGIRFNCISPGLIESSSMYEVFSESEQDKHRSETPTGKFLQKRDLAELVFDICQSRWASLNGQIIDVNGGRHV